MLDSNGDGFITKDSGDRREFPTGSVRDRDSSKSRPDLISPWALERIGHLYRRGAEKYGDRNWEKGQPVSDITASLFRHLIAYMEGDREEDHLAAIAWNAIAIMHFEELAQRGDTNALKMLDEYASKKLALLLTEPAARSGLDKSFWERKVK